MTEYKTYKLSNGIEVINVSPHPFVFLSDAGIETTVPASGIVISSSVEEEIASPPEGFTPPEGVTFQTPNFLGNEEAEEFLKNAPKGVLILGSMIAAQAYKKRICSTVAYPGYERVPVAEKRVREDKFTIY